MFWFLLYAAIFVIIVGHVLLKRMMGESILRVGGLTASPAKPIIHSSKDDLLDYVRSHLIDLKRNRYEFDPHASNFFSNTHDSDIHHDRTDLSQYFEIEQSVPDTKEVLSKLGCNPENTLKVQKSGIPGLLDHQTGNELYFDHGSDGTPTYKPDMYRYENEKVMNGGFIDGVRGVDHAGSDWAVYPSSNDAQAPNWQTSYPYTQSAGRW